MDPLSALALASAVAQFLDFGWKVAKRLEEYSSHNPAEAPRSLQAVCTQLPLLLDALGRMKTDEQVGAADVNTRCILRGVVAGCRAQIAELEAIVDEIARAPGDSLRVRMRKVFVSLRRDEKVWAIERNLHTYVSVLILHHVVDASEAPPPTFEETYYFDVRERVVEPFFERPRVVNALEEALSDAARSLVQSPTVVHVVGDRGVGKTQLVLAYAHQARAQSQFRTVFWRDASSMENLSRGLESVAAVIKRSTDGSRPEKLDFVRAFLGDLWHPWLLVLDNYDPATVSGIMSLLPYRGSGAIVLLSEAGPVAEKNVVNVPKFHSPEEQAQLNTLLANAVQRKDIEGITDLLSQGADVDTKIWGEWPVLHRAVLFGLQEVVQHLLERGADYSPPVQVEKPIYWAAEGETSLMNLLLDHEDATGTFCKPADYDAAFGLAADKGQLANARILLDRRDIRLTAEVKYGQTALQLAAKAGHMELVRLLIDHGALKERRAEADSALLDTASGGHLEVLKVLRTRSKADVNAQDGQGRTALYHAASARDDDYKASGKEMLRYLLDEGANPNLQSRDGGPLHQAAVYSHLEIMELLLAHGADPTDGTCGWTPLSMAIKYNSPEAACLLLRTPVADAKQRQDARISALWVVCRKGDRELALLVLDAGLADLDQADATGRSPLLIAVAGGHVPTARLLVRRGARHDVPDAEGRLPLHLAAHAGYDLLVRDLLRAGAPPDGRDGKGDTAMCLAAAAGHGKVVRQLLEGGASLEAENKFGDTPMDLAEEGGKEDVVKVSRELALK